MTTDVVSADMNGNVGDGPSEGYSYATRIISEDGRYVVFLSTAGNLIASDTNQRTDIFVKDMFTGAVTIVSAASDGSLGNGHSYNPSISADGRYVVFESAASNLIDGDSNARTDIFVKDTVTGAIVRVSTASDGTEGNSSSETGSMSADGRYVAFRSDASNLVDGDTNGSTDIFIKDTLTGIITRASTDTGGTQGNGMSVDPSLSADGRYLVFRSYASNLVADDTNGSADIFIKDLLTGTLTRVSTDSADTQSNGNSADPMISADGRYVVFWSTATNLVTSDSNGRQDVFIKDTLTGTLTRVSTDSAAAQGNGNSVHPSMSADGRFVVFESAASNLIDGDSNARTDIFVKDTVTGAIVRVSTASDRAQGSGGSSGPSISADGRLVVFNSDAGNLIDGDTNGQRDVFIVDNPLADWRDFAPGPEFRASSDTSSLKQCSSVAALEDGGFVVTWSSYNQDGSTWGIYGQRYDAAGSPAGSEFRINTSTTDQQLYSSVAALDGGGFVVTWSHIQNGWEIHGQRYDAAGAPAGSEFKVNTYTTSDQYTSSVAALEGGGFVITWSSLGQDGSGFGIYGQRYNAAGAPAGSEFKVNTYATSDQYTSSVAALEGGGFVITWSSNGQDGSGYGIYGQRYDTDGVPVGSEFRVNTYATGQQQFSSVVALDGGGFLVTWSSSGQTGSSDIYGQRYDADGARNGSEFRVNTYTDSHQRNSSAVALDGGGFVVIWSSYNQDGSTWGIYGQCYDANGSALGPEFRLNQITNGDQVNDSFFGSEWIAQLADGRLVATWTGQNANTGVVQDVLVSLIDLPPNEGLPSITTSEGAATFVESASPGNSSEAVAIDGALVVSDPDSSTLASATVSITNYAPGQDVLGFANTTKISGVFDVLTGVLTLSSAVGQNLTVADWQAALRSVTYLNTSEAPDTRDRLISFVVNDGVGTSVASEKTISVEAANDAPTLTASAITANVLENTTATGIAFTAVDVDNLLGTASFVLSGADAGKFQIVGSGSAGDPFALVFNAAPNFEAPTDAGANNIYDVSVAVTDGELTSSALGLSIAVADVAEGPPPILGTSSNDRLTGTSEADVIEALGGNDRVSAGGGNDRIIGGAGSDTIDGGTWNDTIIATIGDGNDVYKGGSGSDTVDYSAITAPITILLSGIAVSSQTGVDRLSSIENAIGGSGNDVITGSSSANVLSGGSGNDVISGGGGSDRIEGGLGNDRLTGGSGRDVYVFKPGFGNDVITDFDANPRGGQDRLDISALNISAADFAAAVAIVDVGADTIVTIGGDPNQTIRLAGVVDASVITAEDFIV